MPFDVSELEIFKFRLKEGDEFRYVPSPTQDEIDKFSAAYSGAQYAAAGITEAEAEADSTAYQTKLNGLDKGQRRALREEIVEAVIEFCKGTPTAEELHACGAVEQLMFTDWLIGTLAPLL